MSFGDAAYSANEGGSVAVQVQLSADPKRTLTIHLEATPGAGAETGDFMLVPDEVTFNAGETSQSVTFTATDDAEDDDDETVELSFGGVPDDVSEGSPAIVTIADNDEAVTVSFGAGDLHAVTEGWTVDVMVTLNADPERTVTIPVEASARRCLLRPASIRYPAVSRLMPARRKSPLISPRSTTRWSKARRRLPYRSAAHCQRESARAVRPPPR